MTENLSPEVREALENTSVLLKTGGDLQRLMEESFGKLTRLQVEGYGEWVPQKLMESIGAYGKSMKNMMTAVSILQGILDDLEKLRTGCDG
jgi:hypothetical protein